MTRDSCDTANSPCCFAGAAGTLLVTRVVFAELVAVSRQDVRLWVAVVLVCCGCAAVAAALATRRIVRLDPWAVLRRV